MPRLVDNQSRAATLVGAVNQILAEDGVSGLTLRRIAHVSRVSTSSILHHFGSKERLVRVSAGRTARERRTRFLIALSGEAARAPARGLLALLPDTDEDLIAARTWLAWLELWRGDATLATVFDDHLDEMRAILAELMAHRPCRRELSGTLALADGLTSALCAPIRPLSRSDADALLSAHLHTLGVEGAPPGTGPGRVRSGLVEAMLASARRRDPGLFT